MIVSVFKHVFISHRLRFDFVTRYFLGDKLEARSSLTFHSDLGMSLTTVSLSIRSFCAARLRLFWARLQPLRLCARAALLGAGFFFTGEFKGLKESALFFFWPRVDRLDCMVECWFAVCEGGEWNVLCRAIVGCIFGYNWMYLWL
jgi:hypothetical protein